MATDPAQPLAGTRVIDLGWITAGAGSSALLLDLGAEVVKIEGPGALDPFRIWGGADPREDWWDRSPFFGATNRGKRSVCIDLKSSAGQSALWRLLERADVLVENYRRGVLSTLGLDPAKLRHRCPRLVIASISSQGEDGPDRDLVSFGSTLEATSGLAALCGDGDMPTITGRDINYPDQVVCLFAAGAIVAALIERDRTGHGAHLDLSQRELTSFLLGEEILAAAAGAASPRRGNHDPDQLDEQLVRGPGGWVVEWPGGSAPVRDDSAFAGVPEIQAGGALLAGLDGRVVKGLPFQFRRQPLGTPGGYHPLGADNRAVLLEAGLSPIAINRLEQAGVLTTSPRRSPA